MEQKSSSAHKPAPDAPKAPDPDEDIESSDDEVQTDVQKQYNSRSCDRVGTYEDSRNSALRPMSEGEQEEAERFRGKVSEEDEEQEDSDGPADASAKQGLMMRFKKSVSSATVNTRLGRKTISHFIGEGGIKLMHFFKSSATKDKREPFSKQLKRRVLRTAVKTKFLIDNKSLSLNDFSTLNKYSLTLLSAVHKSMSQVEAGKEVDVAEIESLSEMFSQFTVEIVLLLRPHLSPKNIDKLQETLNYWGGRHFLTLIINSPDHKAERIGSIQAIDTMFKEQPAKGSKSKEKGVAATTATTPKGVPAK